MATFRPRQPITTDQPFIDVDAGLPLGRHRFQLVVVDDEGNQSLPDIQVVTVEQRIIPTPIVPRPPVGPITPVRPGRSIGTGDPEMVRPVGGLRKKTKATPKPKPKSKGSKRPRRGGTR